MKFDDLEAYIDTIDTIDIFDVNGVVNAGAMRNAIAQIAKFASQLSIEDMVEI